MHPMIRQFKKQQFDNEVLRQAWMIRRASRQLAGFMLAIALAAVTLFASVAYAQETSALDPVVTVKPTTIVGWILTLLFTGVVTLLGWLLWHGKNILAEKAKTSKIYTFLDMVGSKAYTAGGKAVTKLSPQIQAALADGKIDQKEWDELLTETKKIFFEIAAEELKQVPFLLNMVNQIQLGHWADGVVGNALRKVIAQIAPGTSVEATEKPATEAVPS